MKFQPDPLSTDKKTLLFTKIATVQYDRAHVYRVITNIDKYASVGFEILFLISN